MATSSGGTANTVGLPAEVEDLLAEHGGAAGAARLSFAAAAGYIVVAGAQPGPALVFRAEAGAAHGPRALRVPRPPAEQVARPPALAAWPVTAAAAAAAAVDDCGGGGRVADIGLAALASDGTLRVYDHVEASVDGRDSMSQLETPCREVRLASMLAASAGIAPDATPSCLAAELVHVPPTLAQRGSGPGSLIAFGSQGSAVSIRLDREDLEASPLFADRASIDQARAEHSQSSSYGLGTMLFSVLRGSGWSDARFHSPDWTLGTGTFAVVGHGACAPGTQQVFCARRGGELEMWDSDHKLWTCQISQLAAQALPVHSSNIEILRAVISSEQVIIVLLSASSSTHSTLHAVAVDASEASQPHAAYLVADLGLLVCEPDDVQMAISSDIVYFYVGSTGTLLWTSVSRGLSAESQVKGQLEVDVDAMFIAALDSSNGMPVKSAPIGGRCAFLESDKLVLVSAGVPPPLSMASIPTNAGSCVFSDTRQLDPPSLVWRAYLQYVGSQHGACRATVSTLLMSTLDGDKRPTTLILDSAVSAASRAIVDNVAGANFGSSPLSLLVDARLEKSVDQHRPLLKMLADSDVLMLCDYSMRSEGDRLWDLLSDSARFSIVADAEKLESAYRVRRVENSTTTRFARKGPLSGPGSALGSDASAAVSATLSIFADSSFAEDRDEDIASRPSVISAALSVAGAAALKIIGNSRTNFVSEDDMPIALYGIVSQFERFLPALYREVSSNIVSAQSNFASSPESERVGTQAVRSRRRACRDIIMASDAALAVVEGASAVREECQATFSFTLSSMEPDGGWSCASATCRDQLHGMIDIALGLAEVMGGQDARVLSRSAVALSDALLSCIQRVHVEHQLRTGEHIGNAHMSPSKRRRIERLDSGSDSDNRERRSVLQRLVSGGLQDDAFSLARKFEDFGIMLTLKSSSPTFDEFFEAAFSEFGREFAMFAFRWLEERGEIKLLMCGQHGFSGTNLDSAFDSAGAGSSRSGKVQKMLREYFARDRKGASNLSWMLELACGRFGEAAVGLRNQANLLCVPGKQSSLSNSRLLLSLAKLSLHCSGVPSLTDEVPDDAMAGEKHTLIAVTRDVDRRLYLIRAQQRLDANENRSMDENLDSVLPASVIVQRFMDEAPVESGGLAENAVLALETLSCSELPGHVVRELKDYVWRRCIERQGHVWMPLSGFREMSDSELRGKLMGTALFSAAKHAHFGMNDANDLIGRGVLDIAEFSSAGRVSQLQRLVRTTVSLAASEISMPVGITAI